MTTVSIDVPAMIPRKRASKISPPTPYPYVAIISRSSSVRPLPSDAERGVARLYAVNASTSGRRVNIIQKNLF